MSYQRGDVLWGPDPFKSGENPRPWLILTNDRHPFGDEEYMTVTLTTTPHDEGIPLDDADWVEGVVVSVTVMHSSSPNGCLSLFRMSHGRGFLPDLNGSGPQTTSPR